MADRLSPSIRCAPGTDFELLIAYMCPYGQESCISSCLFSHCWQGKSRKSQDLAWAACSVPRKVDQAATNSAFCWMQGPGTECGLSLGFDAVLLSFSTNKVLLFTVCLGLGPPGQNSGISDTFRSRHRPWGKWSTCYFSVQAPGPTIFILPPTAFSTE